MLSARAVIGCEDSNVDTVDCRPLASLHGAQSNRQCFELTERAGRFG
jgi:hypothetical protein